MSSWRAPSTDSITGAAPGFYAEWLSNIKRYLPALAKLKAQFIGEMAGDEMVVVDRAPFRWLHSATVAGEGATGMETATGRW